MQPETENLDEITLPVEENDLTPEQIHADKTASEFLGEEVVAGRVQEEEVKPDEKPALEAKPEEKPIEAVEVQPALDPDKITEEISAKVTKDLIEKFSPEDATKKEKDDILANAPWTKEGRDPTYQEALKYIGEVNAQSTKNDPEFRASIKKEIMEELNRDAEEEEKKEQDLKVQAETNQARVNEQWKNQWDMEFSDLERSGKIPRVVNADDPKDPGRQARLGILQAMHTVSKENVAKGLPPLMNAKVAYYEHYTPANQQPPGADAPIYGARKGVGGNNSGSYNYDEIHNSSIESLIRAGSK